MLNYLIILTLATFIRRVEKFSKMELNKWIALFMSQLKKFYPNDDLAFAYNDLLHKFGIAATDIKLISEGNDRDYFSGDFEVILCKYWEHSPCEQSARIEMNANDGVLYLAKRIIW